MSVQLVNVFTDFRFQAQAKIPNASGLLVPPTLGQLTAVELRLSASEDGAALDPAVDALATQESATTPGLFYADVDTALLQTHLLPLGVGTSFWAIWKKTGDFDRLAKEFRVSDGTVL